jgi:hypothetical protein
MEAKRFFTITYGIKEVKESLDTLRQHLLSSSNTDLIYCHQAIQTFKRFLLQKMHLKFIS